MNRCYEETARLLKVLAHPARLAIVVHLNDGEWPVCAIQRWLGCRQPYVSQQLGILRRAGLVEYRQEGLSAYYRLTDASFVAGLLAALGLPIQSHSAEYSCSVNHRNT